MRSSLLLVITCFLVLPLGALDTPLVMQAPNGRMMGVVNPTNGTIQIYEMSGQTLVKRTTTNFLTELDFRRIAPAMLSRPEWRMLQVGTATTSPTYNELLTEIFPGISSDREGVEPFDKRVLNTEMEFWAEPPEYDGRVIGAMGNEGLVLVVPSTYTILFYWINGWDVELAGYRNYRTELYIPQVYASHPIPQDLLRMLPEDVQEGHRQQLEEQMAALGNQAGQVIPLAPSEPWITSVPESNTDLFLLLDTANNRLMTYEMRGIARGVSLQLKSARNIEIDLLIPSTLQSEPELKDVVKAFNRVLRKAREPMVSHQYLRKLAGLRAVEAQGSSDIQASIDQEGRLVLDFPKKRKLMVYDPRGRNNLLELKAVRDYTLEIGIGEYQRQLTQRNRAKNELLPIIDKGTSKFTPDTLFRLMELALRYHPHLYEEFEKARSLRKKLEDDPRWQPMIDQAMAEAKRLDDEHEAILEALKQEEAARGR